MVDFSNKVYIAPLTTVGNLPFRRVLKDFGADITCGEMAMSFNVEGGQSSEWALLKRHQQEDVFGIQIAGVCLCVCVCDLSMPSTPTHTNLSTSTTGCNNDILSHTAQLLERYTRTDFIDLNCGCPIDVVTNRGAGTWVGVCMYVPLIFTYSRFAYYLYHPH